MLQARIRNWLKDVDVVKGALGIAFGFLLAALTPWFRELMAHPYSDAALLIAYVANYFIASAVTNKLLNHGTLRKGIAPFFSLEFISWVALFEAMMEFHT